MESAVRKLMCAVAGVVGLTSVAAQSAPFDSLYVFGDSLLDSGNSYLLTGGVYPVSPPYAGVFSNGPVASQVLAARLGLPLAPSAAGGNNYATSGATSGTDNVAEEVYAPFVPPIANLQNSGLQQQVASFTAQNIPASDLDESLFVLWAGSNDAFLLSAAAFADPTLDLGNPAAVAALETLFFLAGQQAAANVEGAILDLVDAGAQTILAGNMPDLTLIPFVTDVQAPFVAQFVLSFTQNFLDPAFLAQLGGLDPLAKIKTFDAKVLFDATVAGYGGFTNVDDPCLPTQGPLPVGLPCSDPDSYLFWDDIHPTAKAHEILGNVMFAAVVPEPQSLLLVALTLGGVVVVRRRRIRD